MRRERKREEEKKGGRRVRWERERKRMRFNTETWYGLDSMPKLLEERDNLAKADRARGEKGD